MGPVGKNPSRVCYFLFVVEVFFSVVVDEVDLVSALIKGTVTLAPSVEADAPITPSLFAFGPRVTVVEQPTTPKKRVATINVVVFFMCFLFSDFLVVRSLKKM